MTHCLRLAGKVAINMPKIFVTANNRHGRVSGEYIPLTHCLCAYRTHTEKAVWRTPGREDPACYIQMIIRMKDEKTCLCDSQG